MQQPYPKHDAYNKMPFPLSSSALQSMNFEDGDYNLEESSTIQRPP
jgi:hypothetical protein